MAKVLKKKTFLEKKIEEAEAYEKELREKIREEIKKHKRYWNSMMVLIRRWYIPAPMAAAWVVLTKKGYIYGDYHLLAGFIMLFVSILIMGYTISPHERNIKKYKIEMYKLEKNLWPWKTGLEGEKRVAAELEKLPEPYYIINDITVKHKGQKAQIDHVVVGPNGVIAIETKHIAGTMYPQGTKWLVRRGYDRFINNPQNQAYFGANLLAKVLDYPVQAMVVLSHNESSWQGRQNKFCPVVHVFNLLNFISEMKETLNNPEKIERIARLIVKKEKNIDMPA